MDYKIAQGASCGLDFSGFHPKCTNVGLILGTAGLMVACFDCMVVASCEAVATKVDLKDCCRARSPEPAETE